VLIYVKAHILFYVEQQPISGPGRLIVEVSTSHIIRHAHAVGLLRKRAQLIAEAITYTTHSKTMHALSGIQTHNPSNQTAADIRLRPHDHQDRPSKHI